MKAILMAAGKGTRMMPLTEERPKPILKIANKPILSYNLDALHGLVDEVLIVVGYKKEKIIEEFGNSYRGIKITYVIQKDVCGTGNAVLQCESFIKGNFFVMNGDDIFSKEDIKKCMKHKYALIGQEVSDPEKYGVFKLNEGCLDCIVEKPKKFVSNLANAGCYKVDDSIFEILKKVKKSSRGEYEFVDAITELAKKEKVTCVKTNKWIAVGYPWHILKANEFFLEKIKDERKGKIEKGVNLKGKVSIGKGTKILSGVYVEGNVIIGDDCKIGPNCYIRGSTSIGDNCHIGQAVEIKNSVIEDNTNIAHLSYVGDSVIGQNVNFGAGTKIANLRHDNKNIKTFINGNLIDTCRRKFGAVVGDNVHTGIDTSIYPGRKIFANKITLPNETIKKDVM
jgi:UDP-N-acetylglucosamine diphosphorylase / glucose-1-phosphate thymidylyltransferase / UDP-N-acetylgalactosamine diphosphorylase / glucosamine-1-phosphate N-acetyltransferase / galactosamine-1-phosphate N-acetyltransferase